MSDARRPFADQYDCALEPVEKFCQLLSILPTAGRDQAINWCGIGLGFGKDVQDDTLLDDSSPQDWLRAPNLEDVRKKLTRLVWNMGVRPEMLLPGLFQYLRANLASLARTDASSAVIDGLSGRAAGEVEARLEAAWERAFPEGYWAEWLQRLQDLS